MKKVVGIVLLSLFSTVCLAQSKLIFAIDLIRHGDRVPYKTLPHAPANWMTPRGELTAKGMQQEFELGKQFRERYIINSHFLPQHYNVKTMWVRATDFDRTLDSAESALYGLYPIGTGPHWDNKPALPQGYQPIPIHTVPKKQDHMLLMISAAFNNILNKTFFNTPKIQQKYKALLPEIKRWRKLTGLKLTSLKGLEALGDNLSIRKRYHLPLPKGMTSDEANKIITLGEWAFVQSFKSKAAGDYIGKAFFNDVLSRFNALKHKKSTIRYVLYSAHDATIMCMMSSLGTPVKKVPHYASDFNMEFYQTNSKPKAPVRIVIKLNGKVLTPPGCQAGYCTIPQLRKIIA